MESMGDGMRRLQAEIMGKLERGELGTTSESKPSSGKTLEPSSEHHAPPYSTDESLTERQLQRRAVIMMEIVQRYIFDKHLDPLEDAELRAVVASYDHLFTHAGIPTAKMRELYAEAMAHHGQYLLKVDDFLRAWERIKPREGDGVDTRHMSERGTGCTRCAGTGMAKKFVPYDFRKPDAGGNEIEFPCPFGCRPMMVKL